MPTGGSGDTGEGPGSQPVVPDKEGQFPSLFRTLQSRFLSPRESPRPVEVSYRIDSWRSFLRDA